MYSIYIGSGVKASGIDMAGIMKKAMEFHLVVIS